MWNRQRQAWATVFLGNLLMNTVIATPIYVPQFLPGSTGRNIRHLPCVSRRTGETGVCMFAFTCAKANGTHLGTCIDRFYFGSCCKIDDEPDVFPQDNSIEDGPTVSRPFLTTPGPIESNDIPEYFSRPRPPIDKKPSSSHTTQTTPSSSPSTESTSGFTSTSKETTKPLTKKPVTGTVDVTTQSTRISTFQTVQNAFEEGSTTEIPARNSTLGVQLTQKPSTLAGTTHNTRRPTKPTVSITQRPPVSETSTKVSSTTKFSNQTTIKPVTKKPSSTSTVVRPSTQTATTRPVQSTVPSKTTQTHKPTHSTTHRPSSLSSSRPTQSVTQRPVQSTTSRIVLTTTQKTVPATRFPPRNSTTVRPLSTQATRRPTTTTKRPSSVGSTKRPLVTTKKPTSPTKRPTASLKPQVTSSFGTTVPITTTKPLFSSVKIKPTIASTTQSALFTPEIRPVSTVSLNFVTQRITTVSTTTKKTTEQRIPTTKPTTIRTSTLRPVATIATTLRPKPVKTTTIKTTLKPEYLTSTERTRPAVSTTVSVTKPRPTVEFTKPKPTVESTKPRPTVEVTKPRPTFEVTKPTKPSTKPVTKLPTSTPATIITTTTTSLPSTVSETVVTNSVFDGSFGTTDDTNSTGLSTWSTAANGTLEELPETTPFLGLVTWSSSSDVVTKPPGVPSTSDTTTLQDQTATDWTPLTTPDGWIMIQSPTTEKLPESPEETTMKPEEISTSQSPTLATLITESSTTEDVTEKPIVSTTSSLLAGVTLDMELPVPMETLNMTDYKQVCGRRLFPESRIVGGNRSSFGKWPWQISLRQWRTSTYLHKCGAALLNENWAITAAHCVENVPPSDLLLRIGEHDLANEEEPYGFQERRVQIVASHPQFDPRTFEYDLALLRFYEPLLPFQPNVLPICLPDDDESYVGRTAYVTGWGRLYDEGPLPSVLQEVAVPVINNSVCETMYRNAGYIEHIPHIFICAGWRNGGFDSCEGDSGGPMVIQRARDKRWILAGVISWGIGCAVPNQPGVYTRISEFREWINQILQF